MVVLLSSIDLNIMKYLLYILGLTLLWSCKASKSGVQTLTYPSKQPSVHMPPTLARIDDQLYQQESSIETPLQIDSVLLDKALLTIYYTSPISIERFELVGSSMLAKSFPPIRNCKLVLLPSAKKGEAGSGRIQFDVRALSHKFTKDAPTYLQIQGWPAKSVFI